MQDSTNRAATRYPEPGEELQWKALEIVEQQPELADLLWPIRGLGTPEVARLQAAGLAYSLPGSFKLTDLGREVARLRFEESCGKVVARAELVERRRDDADARRERESKIAAAIRSYAHDPHLEGTERVLLAGDGCSDTNAWRALAVAAKNPEILNAIREVFHGG